MNKNNMAISLSLLMVLSFAGCQQQATKTEDANKGVAEELVMSNEENVKGSVEVSGEVSGNEKTVNESTTGKIEIVNSDTKSDVGGTIEVVKE